jgi:hypothetical protein
MISAYGPNLARISSRLAANNGRVVQFLELAEAQLSQLASASTEDDWSEVLRLGQYVAETSQAAGHPEIAQQARLVCQHLEHIETRDEALAALVRLIGMCGRVERPEEGQETTRKSSAELKGG